MQFQVNPGRLAEISAKSLQSGNHNPDDGGMCVMEAVAYVAGEPWSDAPQCACPVITAFLVSWNDSLPSDAERDRLLKDLIPEIVGTRSTKAIEQMRATMAADWLIRTYTPAWLRLAKLEKQALLLEALPEITDFSQCPSLMPALQAVRTDVSAAWDAAWDAAWAAAWAAAGDAAGVAARDAAGDAAGAAARAAARDAAGDAARAAAGAAARAAARAAAGDAAWAAARAAAEVAAWAAARAAAGDAARAAAWDALKPTTEHLQMSAVALVRKMISVKDEGGAV
jgi:hypothetical protein